MTLGDDIRKLAALSGVKPPPPQLKVGDKIWRFDTNHRVYEPGRKPYDSKGAYIGRGQPIYREYWVPTEITGETRISWVTLYGKVAKKSTPHQRRMSGWAFTQQEVDDDVWVDYHLHLIQRALSATLGRYTPDIRAKLEAIARTIQYDPESWK